MPVQNWVDTNQKSMCPRISTTKGIVFVQKGEYTTFTFAFVKALTSGVFLYTVDYDDEAMWCMWRDNLFPEDLIALSFELPEDVAESDATTVTPGVTFFILGVFLFLSLFNIG